VLGTFVGIFFGLQKFDVDKITESIPPLLEGLKTAFLTSIIGIILSLIFGKISQIILKRAELDAPPVSTDELSALNEIISILKETKQLSYANFNQLNQSIIHLVSEQESQTAIQTSFSNDLLSQIQNLRADQSDFSKETKKHIEWIVKSMNENNELISKKFDEFSELLAKNNTEALVTVMKKATEQFNKQMSALIEKLVQENFKELNNSVQRMNQWQQENKEMIATLTAQFNAVSKDFSTTSTAIKEITSNTTKLTNENSNLSKLIKELQKVMIEDTKYQEIVGKLTSTIETLKANTDTFDKTTNKLNKWVQNQMNFSDSVAKLLTRLEEIEKIKDINEVFWNNTKKQLNEGVNIIEKASKTLSTDLEKVNAEFYERLNDTLQNLDTLIQRIIAKHK
jgi:uncharacterized phage infection (PIP) family protein YhgE